MSALGRRQWGYWNSVDMLPLEVQLASLPPAELPAVATPRVKGPRGNSDKAGQATRQRIKEKLLKSWGPYCHLCRHWGLPKALAAIDLELKAPHPECFTRDHVKPRSLGGHLYSIRNQRPAHNRCNSFRGNKTMEQVKDCRPAWVIELLLLEAGK